MSRPAKSSGKRGNKLWLFSMLGLLVATTAIYSLRSETLAKVTKNRFSNFTLIDLGNGDFVADDLTGVVNHFLEYRNVDPENQSLIIKIVPDKGANGTDNGRWIADIAIADENNDAISGENYKLDLASRKQGYQLISAGVQYVCANGGTGPERVQPVAGLCP